MIGIVSQYVMLGYNAAPATAQKTCMLDVMSMSVETWSVCLP